VNASLFLWDIRPLSDSLGYHRSADATLHMWNLDFGVLVHVLAAYTDAITCFVHDDLKVLSGSDGNLKI